MSLDRDKVSKRKIIIEVASNTKGEILWMERYRFSRMSAIGEKFVRDSKQYVVMAAAIVDGDYGAALLEHVVEECPDCGRHVCVHGETKPYDRMLCSNNAGVCSTCGIACGVPRTNNGLQAGIHCDTCWDERR